MLASKLSCSSLAIDEMVQEIEDYWNRLPDYAALDLGSASLSWNPKIEQGVGAAIHEPAPRLNWSLGHPSQFASDHADHS